MARKFLITTLAALTLAGAAAAQTMADPELYLSPRTLDAASKVEAVALGQLARDEVDTTYLLGGPDRHDGRFENQYSQPNWYGWEHHDFTTASVEGLWNITDEARHVLAGARSMICGAYVDVPGGTEWGYGNDWKTALVFKQQVDDPEASSNVRIRGLLRVDAETDYDYVYLQVKRQSGWVNVDAESFWDDRQDVVLDFTFMVAPRDYAGDASDEIWLRFYFESDVAWSDEDDLWDSDGPAVVDNLEVSVDDSVVDSETFEDGVSQRWQEEVIIGVGDFAKLYLDLQDLDPCRSNSSWQVAFIDDGIIVPGTGGTPGQTWRYGPGGYIVNNTGGLLGPEYYIENGIVSPPLAWPEGHDAARMVFGVYMHEPMTQLSGGTMYVWWVRSTTDADSNMLRFADWDFDNTVWYGPPVYNNHLIDLTSYLEPGRKWFQVRLEVWEAGHFFEVNGTDGTPHPYFDNIRVFTYPFAGPAINYDALFVAQDDFPDQGALDLTNLASNHVRFDMARNISPSAHLRNDPGDSLYVDVVPVRAGSVLEGRPQLVLRMKANPLFDDVRVLPPGFTQVGNIITGSVSGRDTYTSADPPQLVEDRYNFDLPDSTFFFPGDVIHYYFEAWDNMAGDIGHTMLPGDTAGFACFDHDLDYPSDFICRALPTVFTATAGDQPPILLWNDFGNRGGENEWLYALHGAGLVEGVDFDIFYTNAPDAGEGNGLGGRATAASMEGYDILLYTFGDMLAYSLGDGNFATDPSQDIELLNNWFDKMDKKAIMTGDDLVFDLTQKGVLGLNFISNYLGVQLVDRQLHQLIGNQTSPTVVPMTGNGLINYVDEWIACGGCTPLPINSFDAIEVVGNATRIAEFTNPDGQTGAYTYAAAVHKANASNNAEVVLLPYDLMWVFNSPGYLPPAGFEGVAARSILLRDLLNSFGMLTGAPIGVDTPAVQPLGLSVYPNPFNPATTVALDMPRRGTATLKIYNVRGELVHTLFDGDLVAGRHELAWDGRTDAGSPAASGVYFAEVKACGETRIERMAMIK